MHQTTIFVPDECAVEELREQFAQIDGAPPSDEIVEQLRAISEGVVDQFPLTDNNWYDVLAVWLPDRDAPGRSAPGKLVHVVGKGPQDPAKREVVPVTREEMLAWVIRLVRTHLFFLAGRCKYETGKGFVPDESKGGPWPSVEQLLEDPRRTYDLGIRLVQKAARRFIDQVGGESAGVEDVALTRRRLWELSRLAEFVVGSEVGPFSNAAPEEHVCFSFDGSPAWEDLDKLSGAIVVDMHV